MERLTILPSYVVVDLYRRRWRIEDAFNTVKRLLGLSYLWTGSINDGIQLQIWGTWLFYEEEFRSQEPEFSMNSMRVVDEYWSKTLSLVELNLV